MVYMLAAAYVDCDVEEASLIVNELPAGHLAEICHVLTQTVQKTFPDVVATGVVSGYAAREFGLAIQTRISVVVGFKAALALHPTLTDLQDGRPIRLNTRAETQPIAHYLAAVLGLDTLQPGRSAEISSQLRRAAHLVSDEPSGWPPSP